MPEPEKIVVSNGEETESDAGRTKQVTVAGWTTGLTAFFGVGALAGNPSWPLAFGVAALAMMVAITCYFILKKS